MQNHVKKMAGIVALLTAATGFFDARPAAAHTSQTSSDGCCTDDLEHCVARPTHPRSECRAGHKGLGVTFNCANVGCIGFPLACVPDIETGSVLELPNGIDDDCDFFVDDEQCDGVDIDLDGMIDEDLGSCLLKILFVPMCWEGTQSEFEAAAADQFEVFRGNLGLACPDNFSNLALNINDVNLQCPACTNSCGIDEVTAQFGQTLGGVNVADFDVVAALTDGDPCALTAGCSNGSSAFWLETGFDVVFAHELGHVLGLADEYCSKNAGSLCPRCNQGSSPQPCDVGGQATCQPPPNFLGSDLGCDPNEDGCCSDCSGEEVCKDDYEICCEGNKALVDGRCIMSYADADDPRAFCDRCEAHLQSPPNAKSAGNPTGQVPMDCSFSHLGSQPIADMEIGVDPDGKLTILKSSIGVGRLGLGAPSTSGQYGITIFDASGSALYSAAFDLVFGYTDPRVAGVDYSSIRYDRVVRGIRARIPPEIGPSDALKVVASKDGTPTWQSTVNGMPPIANAGPDRAIECTGAFGATATLDGTGSTDPDGDTLGYLWSGDNMSLSFEDPTSATPIVTLPFGSTIVSLVVNDGISSSAPDTALLTVSDSTPPVLTLAATPSVLSPPNHRMVDIQIAAQLVDVCDPSPTFVLTSITSNEPDGGSGDGNTTDDIQDATLGTPDLSFKLRAERKGNGSGRIYTITYTASDSAGSQSLSSVTVTVPH
jgi:hypothetical protein